MPLVVVSSKHKIFPLDFTVLHTAVTVNLSSLGQDDSSSEEAQSIPPTNGKPAVPPRPRSISVDHKRNGGMPGLGSGPLKAKPHNYEELPTKDIDVDSADCKNPILVSPLPTKS